MKQRRILVTGGAGFIGSHLCERLLLAGLKPVVIDNLSVGKIENIPKGCEFIKGDIQNFRLIKRLIKDTEAIFHLAANVTIRGSVTNFYNDAKINIMGTLNLLRACQSTPSVKKFIFSSSMAVYADSRTPKPVSENYKTQPISPYGIAKLACERYVLVACGQMGIKRIILRYFNTYGPKQTFTPYVGVINIFINRLLDNQPLTVYGDGEQRRDFVHVKDVAEATYKAFETDIDGQILNVGTGVSTSVNQIAAILAKKINPSAKIKNHPPHLGELRNSIANVSKLKKLTGFKPKTRFEEKIDGVIDYIRKSKATI